jgi:hypothetical protein
MALTLPGHSAPAVGFEVPLEMLAACHGRVQHQCETLQRLVTHLQSPWRRPTCARSRKCCHALLRHRGPPPP